MRGAAGLLVLSRGPRRLRAGSRARRRPGSRARQRCAGSRAGGGVWGYRAGGDARDPLSMAACGYRGQAAVRSLDRGSCRGWWGIGEAGVVGAFFCRC